MTKGTMLKCFVSQRVHILTRQIHVRRLLLTDCLHGILTREETALVENERSETAKCELFLQSILRKEDMAVELFMQALREKQPKLGIHREWEDCCNQEIAGFQEAHTSVKEPTESADYSEMRVMYNEPTQAAECFHGNDLSMKASPLTADFTLNKNIEYGSSGQVDEAYSIATKVINCLSQHLSINLIDREDINRALEEKDAIRDTNQRLVDIVVRLVRQQRLSPYVVEEALNSMGLNDLAQKLLHQTVHDKYIHDLPVEPWTKLTQELSVKTYNQKGDTWKRLPSLLGIEAEINIQYTEGYSKNPAEEILNVWRQKRGATIRNLYQLLLSIEAVSAAVILEPYLPVVMATEEQNFNRSTSTCSSISDNELITSKSL